MLEPVSHESQVVRTAETAKPNLVERTEEQAGEIFQSVARRNDLEFQSSLSRFRLAGPVTAQTPATPVNNVRTDVVDQIVESFDNTPPSSWQDRLLYVLKEDEDLNLTHDEQKAVIGGLTDRMLNEDYAGELLRTTFLNFDTPEFRNVGYDNQQFLSGLIGDAYEAGYISETDLHQIAQELGAEDTEGLILNLASVPGNLANYGSARVVETLGRQAETLGYETAAALAFTSSESLIAEHYSSPQAQREAFDLVRGYIERFDEQHERTGFTRITPVNPPPRDRSSPLRYSTPAVSRRTAMVIVKATSINSLLRSVRTSSTKRSLVRETSPATTISTTRSTFWVMRRSESRRLRAAKIKTNGRSMERSHTRSRAR